MYLISLLWLCACINALNDTTEDFRKHYGLSIYNKCHDYIKTFKCLTACKAIGFQMIRMDRTCKCSCHVMKTTTPVPFFMWRTNGTTRKLPFTDNPRLYNIVGTLSPATYVEDEYDEENHTMTTTRNTDICGNNILPNISDQNTTNISDQNITNVYR
ncbi:hypothetical protein ACJJTC_009864 [Scirpophaga incertulas]